MEVINFNFISVLTADTLKLSNWARNCKRSIHEEYLRHTLAYRLERFCSCTCDIKATFMHADYIATTYKNLLFAKSYRLYCKYLLNTC